jgi:hypothetical protein
VIQVGTDGEIAKLGIEIDSSQAKSAAADIPTPVESITFDERLDWLWGRSPGTALHNQFSLRAWRLSAEFTNCESRSWINRGDFGDDHRGCDIRDDAVLDPLSVVDGIFVVARTP